MITRTMPIERVSPKDDHHYWVGYYDKQPWSSDASAILSHRAGFCDRLPKPGESCEIGVIRDGAFVQAAQSMAWNWQQGAQLRWSSLTGEESLMFNDLDEQGRLISRWVREDGQELHRIDSPIYAVSPDHRVGLTLSFGRLTRLRAEYGYPAVRDAHPDTPAPEDDGIWRVDLRNGERELLISTAQLAKLGDSEVALDAPDAPHQHLNHIMIDPSARRCCFLHRYERADRIQHSRLFTIGLDGSRARMLMEGLVSHYEWRDDSSIIAWGGKRKLLGSGRSGGFSPMRYARRMLKPIYYTMGKPRFLMNKLMGDSYLVIPDREGAPISVFAKGELNCDGHNTFLRDEDNEARWMLTDGYPDMKSCQPLYIWDMSGERGYEIGRYHTPPELDGDARVDLHPRFSRDGCSVCIDSAMDGSRAIYIVGIDRLTITNRGDDE